MGNIRPLPALRPQQLLVLQRPLQGGLHFHVAELADGEVQVLQGLGTFIRVALQQQLGEVEAG